MSGKPTLRLGPRKPCPHPGCKSLQPCSDHVRKAWHSTHGKPKRIGESKRTAARKRLFSINPLCVMCQANGVVRAATQRDHIVPLAEGGTEDESNTQGLCVDCHRQKTAQESRRGMG